MLKLSRLVRLCLHEQRCSDVENFYENGRILELYAGNAKYCLSPFKVIFH